MQTETETETKTMHNNNRTNGHHHPRRSYRYKRKQNASSKAAIGKIGGLMLFLILVILFVAAHGRHNEMMYVALFFVFMVIVLFSYGYWSAVNRGDGIWQYIGKNNLQHQQVSSPDYHFDPIVNFKNHPRSKRHMVAPPKMGGVRLEIYTLDQDEQLKASQNGLDRLPVPDDSGSLPRHQHRHHHHHHHQHQHNQEVHRLYHQHLHEQFVKQSQPSPIRTIESPRSFSIHSADVAVSMFKSNGNLPADVGKSPEGALLPLLPIRSGQSCVNLPLHFGYADHNPDTETEPVKCEVNLSRSSSHSHRHHRHQPHQREGFAEVQLPIPQSH